MFCRSLEPNRRGDGSTSRRLVRLATVALCLSWTVAAADVASAHEPTDRTPSPRASTDAEDASRSTGPPGRAVQWLYVTSLGSASMLAVGYAAYRLALRQGRFDHAPDRVEEREPILGGAGLEDVADSLEQPVGPSEALVAVDRIEGVERGDSATSETASGGRICPECGERFPESIAFCPADATPLATLDGAGECSAGTVSSRR